MGMILIIKSGKDLTDEMNKRKSIKNNYKNK